MEKRFLPVLVRVIVLLTCWFYASSVFGQDADGSADHPYPINSVTDLNNLQTCLRNGQDFHYAGGTFYISCDLCTADNKIPAGGAGKYFKITADLIYNQGKDVAGCNGDATGLTVWYPAKTFKGNLDGDGHIISGLYIVPPYNDDKVGLFSQVDGHVTVKNLGFVNTYIKGHSGGNNIYAGVIAGELSFSTVENCFFEGYIDAAVNNVGGIAGYCNNATIRNCYAIGHLETTQNNIGGICGQIANSTTITNCYSSMILHGGTNSSNIGGICGLSDGTSTISNCFFDKQMSSMDDATGATGKLTRELMATNFSALGSAFVTSEADYYPYLNVFGFSKPAVKFSCLPLKLADADNYVDNLLSVTAAFTLPTMANVSWGKDNLWPSAVTVSDNTVTPVQQGSVRFTATLADDNTGHTRYYDIVPNKAPFVGSEDNPFTIDSLANLKDFRDGINSGSDFTYKRFTITRLHGVMDTIHWKQTADIDMGNTEWTPIGKDSTIKNSFRGIYDGGDHQIHN